MGGDIRLRFDQSPVRFGNYILESLNAGEASKDCCGFCNEPLHTYYRVGSQQACPACTEKFRQEMQSNLARYYRRSLVIGIASGILGLLIHRFVLLPAGLSFGPILIGLLVGFTMRTASKESAGVQYRMTAAAITLLAGVLPSTSFTLTATIYIAIGMFAAWTVSARNVRTAIHGPFQSKTA
jgi:hypothetical protein